MSYLTASQRAIQMFGKGRRKLTKLGAAVVQAFRDDYRWHRGAVDLFGDPGFRFSFRCDGIEDADSHHHVDEFVRLADELQRNYSTYRSAYGVELSDDYRFDYNQFASSPINPPPQGQRGEAWWVDELNNHRFDAAYRMISEVDGYYPDEDFYDFVYYLARFDFVLDRDDAVQFTLANGFDFNDWPAEFPHSLTRPNTP